MEGTTIAGDPSSSTSTSTSTSASTTSKGKTAAEKKKRRTEVKRIEERGNLFVTYSKRRKGLYSKARQLCGMAPGAQAAVITFSPSGKLCAFGNPSVDAVVNRYLLGQNDADPSPSPPTEAASAGQPREEGEESTVNGDAVGDHYLLSQNNVNPLSSSSPPPPPDAKNGVVAARFPQPSKEGEGGEEEKDEELRFYREEIERLWRDDSEEDMSSEELKEYKGGLEGLRYKVYVKLEEIRRRDCTRIFF